MYITIINGSPNDQYANFDRHMQALDKVLSLNGHVVHNFNLRGLTINDCIGCFHCLVKEPGICIHKEDYMKNILEIYCHSDVVILGSPLIVGYVSSVLKKMIDRLLPLFHAHLKIYNGLLYHLRRYKKYPHLVLILEETSKSDSICIDFINQSFERMNLNYSFTKLTSDPIEATASEINNL